MDVPGTSPKYVRDVFPAILQSLYNCFNDALKQIAIGINDSMEHMQNKVNSLESILQVYSTKIASLKDTLKQKDYVVHEQANMISNLQKIVSAIMSLIPGETTWYLVDSRRTIDKPVIPSSEKMCLRIFLRWMINKHLQSSLFFVTILHRVQQIHKLLLLLGLSHFVIECKSGTSGGH